MANYYAAWRTNYFKVKDLKAFEAVIKGIPFIEIVSDNDGYIAIMEDYRGDSAGIPNNYFDDDDNDVTVEWSIIFKEHLEDNSIVVFMEAGSEKLRYILGYAMAINSEGEVIEITLDDIYKKAHKKWGKDMDITRAEY